MALEDNVDNPELRRLMIDDLNTGAITEAVFGADKIGDLEKFYSLWRQPLHFKQLHEAMAKDVRSVLKEGAPDVIIMVAGTPHITGLNQQLTELRDSKKIVIGNIPQCSSLMENILYNGNPRLIEDVGEKTEFEVDSTLKKATVPALATRAINEKSQSKKSQTALLDPLDLELKKIPSPTPEKSYAEKMSQVKGSKFNEI